MEQLETIVQRLEDDLRTHYNTILHQQQGLIEDLQSQIKHINAEYGKDKLLVF